MESRCYGLIGLMKRPQEVSGEKQTVLLDKALDALDRAVTEGFSAPFCIKAEYELRPLRNNPKFESILGKIM